MAHITPLTVLTLAVMLLAAVPSAIAYTGTSLDSKKNIQFTFGDDSTPSIKIAKRASAPINSNCNVNYEGALRYNSYKDKDASKTDKNIKGVEYCNGSKWKLLGGKTYSFGTRVSIDYPSCINALKNKGTNYYQRFGAKGTTNINLMCPRNYIIVATDNMPDTGWSHYTEAFCCKMKFK